MGPHRKVTDPVIKTRNPILIRSSSRYFQSLRNSSSGIPYIFFQNLHQNNDFFGSLVLALNALDRGEGRMKNKEITHIDLVKMLRVLVATLHILVHGRKRLTNVEHFLRTYLQHQAQVVRKCSMFATVF